MSVLDDFVRIRLYRERASEFELLAETEAFPDVRLRFGIIARHYRELMDRELQADKARMAELTERARHQRQQAAAKGTLPATNDTQFFLIAADELVACRASSRASNFAADLRPGSSSK